MNKSLVRKSLWLTLVLGMLTGMGNGSVFGAALMCFMGRGRFDEWGGWMVESYQISTFNGFMTWCMLVFGVMYIMIMLVALQRHDALERAKS